MSRMGKSILKRSVGTIGLLAAALSANYLAQKFLDRSRYFSEEKLTSNSFYPVIKRQTSCFSDRMVPWQTTDESMRMIARQLKIDSSVPSFYVADSSDKKVALAELTVQVEQKVEKNAPSYDICVGGVPTAMSAYQLSKTDGDKFVIYINSEEGIPIHAGAANHIEPDSVTEGPAALSGYGPFDFTRDVLSRVIFPRQYSDAPKANFPWKSLNIIPWFAAIAQIPQAIQVFLGNESLVRKIQSDQAYKAKLQKHIVTEVQASEKVLTAIDQELREQYGKGIFRTDAANKPIAGSLYIAKSPQEKEALESMREALKGESKHLTPISLKQAEQRFGIKPDGQSYLKSADRILSSKVLPRLIAAMKNNKAAHHKWRLQKIWISPDTTSQPHIAEFIDPHSGKSHYLKAKSLHMSLGATEFSQLQSAMISATGVSATGFIKGKLLGTVVCGQTNHITPLGAPQKINGDFYTPIRATCAAAIGPRHMGPYAHSFFGQDAASLIEHVEQSFDTQFNVVTIRGCHRQVSAENFGKISPLLFNERRVDNITVQQGFGGGGLTQSGREASTFS